MAETKPQASRLPRRRGRARSLDREKILGAALALSRREGLEGLSMRRVAGALDVDVAALYWHFRNKDELLSELHRVGAEAADLSVPVEGPWQERCRSLCRALRRELHQRPELALQGGGALWATPFNARANGLLVEILGEAGLRGPDRIYASFALLHQVNALAASESLHRTATREALREFVRGVSDGLPGGAADGWREVAQLDSEESFGATFEFAIGALIRGIEERVIAGREA